MDSLEILTVDGQLRPNQPAIEDPNESLLDIEDDTFLSGTEEDIRDIEIPDAQPKREDQAPQPTRGRVMRNPEMENQLGARSKKPNERKRKLDTLNRHQSQDGKKPRRAMEVISLNTKIERSETA